MPSSRKGSRGKAEDAPVLDPPKRREPAHVNTRFVWRRLHDGNIIAEASPVLGMGTWHVCAYRTSGKAESAHHPRSFSLLREAHKSADELVREHFDHVCRTGVCGRWLRWPER